MGGEMRKIDAQVEISYGNEEFASELTFSSDDSDPKSRLEDLYRSKSSFDSGASNDLVGWFSTEKSYKKPDSVVEDCYAFEKFPTLTINFGKGSFGKGRSIKLWQLQGDYERKEYPTKFQINIYVIGKKDPYELDYDNVLVDWEGTNLVWDNLDLGDKFSQIYGNVSGVLDNGYILNVYKMEIIIRAWNKPECVSHITRCYDDIIERYGRDEFKSFECIRELSVSDGIGYGLVSGTCSATLLNNKGRKFDEGYLKNISHVNRRISPYINGKRMGSYYIKKWDISQSDMFVKCDANDRLIDFQDIMYEGRMPHENETKVTFAQLFKEVLESAKQHFINGFHYEIESSVEDISFKVEPYLPRKSIWDILQLLCNASMSFVYVDNNDFIRVCSELAGREKLLQVAEPVGADICEHITPSNAYSIDIPFFADMETNKVDIAYYNKTSNNEQELFRINDYNKQQKEYVEETIEFDKYCKIEKLTYAGRDYIQGEFSCNKVEDSDFKYLVSFIVDRLNDEKSLIIKGTVYSFEKQTAGYENEKSTALNALSLYKYPDCELIQSKDLAKHIAMRLTELYPTGTRSVTSEWRGEEKLSLLDKCNVTDIFKHTDKYLVSYVRNNIDGGFRQEIKGFSIKEIT